LVLAAERRAQRGEKGAVRSADRGIGSAQVVLHLQYVGIVEPCEVLGFLDGQIRGALRQRANLRAGRTGKRDRDGQCSRRAGERQTH
jgi:hypothetical protein